MSETPPVEAQSAEAQPAEAQPADAQSTDAQSADAPPEPAAPPAKADPESLVLRARPPRVVRFKRSIVIALSALAVSGVALTAWLALRPPSLRLLNETEEPGELATAPAEALAGLPHSYADAPQLGPPLPGDLGRAIVEHQRSLDAAGADAVPDAEQQAAQAERERIAAERRSARESSILVQTGGRGREQPAPSAATGASALGTQAATAESPLASHGELPVDRVAVSRGGGAGFNPSRIESAPSPYLLSAGSVIAASLVTGLRSDLPGLVIAQVTERVYDSPTGRLLLIPQGARLIGNYDDAVAFGQRRARIVWQRIVFPDGRSLALGDVPATDAAGYAGLEDKVDFHTGTLVRGAAISTLLGVGTSLTFAGESDLVEALRESTQQNVSRAGDQLVSRDLQIRPTITIRPGTPVRLVVHRDLVLAPPAN